MLPERVMLFLSVLILALCSFEFSQAANACTKDSCYNAVAVQQNGGPNLNSRKADCSAILRTVIDDDRTVILTRSTTVYSETLTISTQSDTKSIGKRQYNVVGASAPRITPPPDLFESSAELMPRDKIVVSGSRPSYASACKNVQSYAVACLCYGIKASNAYVGKTSVTTRTVSAISTTTTGYDFVSYLRQNGQEFCTSYNGYIAPISSVTASTEVRGTSTIVDTVTATSSTTSTSILDAATIITVPAPIWRRRGHVVKKGLLDPAEIMMPPPLKGLSPSQISSLCARVATGTTVVTSTSTTTVIEGSVTATTTDVSFISFETIVYRTTTTATELPVGPTPIMGSLAGAVTDVDELNVQVVLPFQVGLYGVRSSAVCVSDNSYIWFTDLGCDTNEQRGQTLLRPVSDQQNLYIFRGKPQGVDYEVKGSIPSRTARFRWYIGQGPQFGGSKNVWNFTATFYEERPGVVLFTYYQTPLNEARVESFVTDQFRSEKFQYYQAPPVGFQNGATVLYDTNAAAPGSVEYQAAL